MPFCCFVSLYAANTHVHAHLPSSCALWKGPSKAETCADAFSYLENSFPGFIHRWRGQLRVRQQVCAALLCSHSVDEHHRSVRLGSSKCFGKNMHWTDRGVHAWLLTCWIFFDRAKRSSHGQECAEAHLMDSPKADYDWFWIRAGSLLFRPLSGPMRFLASSVRVRVGCLVTLLFD